MRKSTILIFGILLITNLASSQIILKDTLSDRIANYDIDVALDVNEKMLHGKLVLHWKNPSQDTLNELQFHLYLNAFKNTKSTFLKESDTRISTDYLSPEAESPWGWIDIEKMKIIDGEDLTDKISFIQPDDISAPSLRI